MGEKKLFVGERAAAVFMLTIGDIVGCTHIYMFAVFGDGLKA